VAADFINVSDKIPDTEWLQTPSSHEKRFTPVECSAVASHLQSASYITQTLAGVTLYELPSVTSSSMQAIQGIHAP
jgi:hypothetical protein